MSDRQADKSFADGRLTRFHYMFRNFLNGELRWPEYTPNDVARVRASLNLTQDALGELLMVSPKTVLRWETEGEKVPPSVCIALCVLQKLGADVFELMKPEYRSFALKVADWEKQDMINDMADSVQYNLAAQRQQAELPKVFDQEAVSTLRKRLGLTREKFAQVLGVSRSTAIKWENGSVTPKGPALTILQILWQKGLDALSNLPDSLSTKDEQKND
ncbi:MAG: helix-turn-helix domain-containing protein [Sutterellaceae bacterium]|nr:helix-turn-helix domain-containing protein [Sutterellaceae bacterium]